MTDIEQRISKLVAPWDDGRPSIQALIARAEGLGAAEGQELRIEVAPTDPKALRWAPGALDSLFGAPDGSPRQVAPRKLAAALSKAVRSPSTGSAGHLYALLEAGEAIRRIDPVLTLLSSDKRLDRRGLAALARRIAREAPDVEPVKIAIALLGVFGEPRDAELAGQLGRYEELTLYSAVALSNLLVDPEGAIWSLARQTYGWGRVRAVRLLRDTTDPDIKAWLLAEGYRNGIMYEYLAYTCAITGGLRAALERSEVDDATLVGAAEILDALLATGGPAEDITDYEDGGAVARLFLDRVSDRSSTHVAWFEAASTLLGFVEDKTNDWARLGPLGWSAEARFDIRSKASHYVGRADWKALATAGLDSADEQTFRRWARVAEILGLDPWPRRLERQRAGVSDEWWFLMQTDRGDRIDQIVELAQSRLDLEAIGSGPEADEGFDFMGGDDGALDFVLQDLRRFPGKGWPLIEVGLRARGVRCRNMALKALAAWGRLEWPNGAEMALRRAVGREPDEQVLDRMKRLLAAQPLDD